MLISEVAKLEGVSEEEIRHYEELGSSTDPKREPNSLQIGNPTLFALLRLVLVAEEALRHAISVWFASIPRLARCSDDSLFETNFLNHRIDWSNLFSCRTENRLYNK